MIAIDGKTVQGNRNKNQSLTHIATAYSAENKISFQITIDDKSNEITAIPRLLRTIDIRKGIVIIDAMGTQTDIVDGIIKGKRDYCLVVKGNQGTLYDAISLYFGDVSFRKQLEQKGQHYQTV